MKLRQITIVGLGLIGGSIGSAVRKYLPDVRVIGVSRDQKRIELAKKKGIIHTGTRELRAGLIGTDLVLICTPVDTILKLVLEIDRLLKTSAVVTDVGSTKDQLTKGVNRSKLKHVEFIGSHPFAGSHHTGLTYSDADLFLKAQVMVTQSRHTTTRANETVVSFWKKLGGKVIVLSSKKHDQIASQISHLPHVVAASLVCAVSKKFLCYGATGFRDTTRIAQSDPKLWRPILMSNRERLIQDLIHLQSIISNFISNLKKDSGTGVEKLLRQAFLKCCQLALQKHSKVPRK